MERAPTTRRHACMQAVARRAPRNRPANRCEAPARPNLRGSPVVGPLPGDGVGLAIIKVVGDCKVLQPESWSGPLDCGALPNVIDL
jgi:hypothetical protein